MKARTGLVLVLVALLSSIMSCANAEEEKKPKQHTVQFVFGCAIGPMDITYSVGHLQYTKESVPCNNTYEVTTTIDPDSSAPFSATAYITTLNTDYVSITVYDNGNYVTLKMDGLTVFPYVYVQGTINY